MGYGVPKRGTRGTRAAARTVLAVLFTLLLSGCDFIAADTESLLQRPTLSKQQEAIYAALETTRNRSDIVFEYPQSGDYRSPFVIFDMDGDGVQEAIIFYSNFNESTNIRIMVLREDGSDAWSVLQDLSLNCEQIDFVQFSPLLSTDAYCLIVGLIDTGTQISREESKFLNIYSLTGNRFVPEVTGHYYANHLIQDFDGNGLEDVVTVGWSYDRNQALTLSLLRSIGSGIDLVGTLPLSNEAESLEQMLYGPLWDGAGAVYLDEMRRDSFTSMATEIIRVDASGMTVLAGGNRPADTGAADTAWDNYEYTFRDGEMLSRDYNGDGIVEIPNPEALPGNLYEGDDDPLMLTQLMQLTGEGFVVPQKAVINTGEGYLFLMPEDWLDLWGVSVMRDDEAGEWKFYIIDPDTSDPTVELLRIQTTGIEADIAGMIDLGSRGSRRFCAYIPVTTASVPAITQQEVEERFIILT